MEASGTIDSKSVFYRLAYVYGPLDKYQNSEVDRCKYYRSVFLGMLLPIILAAFGSMIGMLFISFPLAHIAAMITVGHWIAPDEAEISYYAWAFCLCVATIGYVAYQRSERQKERAERMMAEYKTKYGDDWYDHWYADSKKNTKEPSEFTKWMRSLKDKTCVMLEVK